MGRLVRFRECGESLYGSFPLRLKRVVRPKIQHRSSVWCQKENWKCCKEQISMVKAMYVVQLLNDRKRAKYLIVMLGLNEAIDLLHGMVMC